MKTMKAMTLLICILLLNVSVVMAQDTGLNTDTVVKTGTVVEAIEAGNYVYIRLETPDAWIATTSFAVSTGDRVQYSGGMEMREFHSESLDRTFDSVFFLQNVRLAKDDADAQAVGTTPVHEADKPPVTAAGDVTALQDGKTIAEIYADATRLKGQKVNVNAMVVKVSKNIMGANWITLKDGSGTEPDNKLIVTSAESPEIGKNVIASGIVRTDVNLGSGYSYKVLLENAGFLAGSE